MKEILKSLFNHHTLSGDEAKSVLGDIAEGKYHPNEVSAFLTVYKMRSITLDELTGFRDCLRERCRAIDLSAYDPIDMCGTGGDGKNTFNISTLASIVTAAAGIPVAKHGNYGVSSACGSSNVMKHLGYEFSIDVGRLQRQMDTCNITFLHAPLFHPAMKKVAPIRRSLGVSTFFNMLGPMVNPSFPQKQVVGVFSLELQRYYKYIYGREQVDYYIVHALDGYDELSLTASAKVCGIQGDQLLEAADFNTPSVTKDSIFGGETVAEAAAIFMTILNGDGSNAQASVVAANAALSIHCARPSISLSDAFLLSQETIANGKARQTFKKLIAA